MGNVGACNRMMAKVVARENREHRRKAVRFYARSCKACRDQSAPEATEESILVAEKQSDPADQLQSFKERMTTNGWCHHQVNHLSKQYDLKTFEYLSSRSRSSLRLEDHTPCTKKPSCVAYNTEESTYSTRHVTPDCACAMLETPYSSLVKILRNGQIPLVSLDGDGSANREYALKVHPKSTRSRYVAISHVWADGLGNPRGNALPTCQIVYLMEKLSKLWDTLEGAEKLKGPILFWMDTLCIPAKQQDRAWRIIQINKMASIYRGAVCALVLDRELMSFNSGNEVENQDAGQGDIAPTAGPLALSLDSRARMACSVWMSRSWTLQEGKLPRLIAVQFSDEAYIFGPQSHTNGLCVERTTRNSKSETEDSDSSVTPTSIVSESNTGLNIQEVGVEVAAVPEIRSENCICVEAALEKSFFSMLCTDSMVFPEIWNEIAGRSTTKSEDVPFMVTNLLDRENTELLKYHETGKMLQAIILSLPTVPLSLFFLAGPKHDPAGNHKSRWVPRDVHSQDGLESQPSMKVCRDHFQYQYSPDDCRHDIYTIDQVVPMVPGARIRLENKGAVYTVDRAGDGPDQLDLTGFTSTCLFVQWRGLSDQSDKGRVVCFYFRQNKKAGGPASWLLTILKRPLSLCFRRWKTREAAAIPRLTMTFNCSFELYSSKEQGPDVDNAASVYTFLSPATNVDFRFQYDTHPRFKPLKKRIRPKDGWNTMQAFRTAMGVIGGVGALFIWMSFATRGPASLGGGTVIIGWIIGFIAGLLWASMGDGLVWLYVRWRKWYYLWSIEAVARKRARLDGV